MKYKAGASNNGSVLAPKVLLSRLESDSFVYTAVKNGRGRMRQAHARPVFHFRPKIEPSSFRVSKRPRVFAFLTRCGTGYRRAGLSFVAGRVEPDFASSKLRPSLTTNHEHLLFFYTSFDAVHRRHRKFF